MGKKWLKIKRIVKAMRKPRWHLSSSWLPGTPFWGVLHSFMNHNVFKMDLREEICK